MPRSAGAPPAGRVARPRVLIVEDDPQDSLAMEAALARAGCDVVTAETLAAGRALLDPELDDLVLDLILPDGDGTELLRAVRTAGARTKVVVVTAASDPAVLGPVLDLKPDLLLGKPIDLALLLRALGLPE